MLNIKHLSIYFLISTIIGFGYNFFIIDGIPLLAKPLNTVDNNFNLNQFISEPMIREVSLETAIRLHDQGVLFIDARAEEYLADGFILGAIANDDINLLESEIIEKIGYDTAFVVYCSDDECGSSEQMAYDLQDLGFMNILVFKGGWKSWKENNLPVEIINE